MSRRHSTGKREISADARYDSILLSKFINKIMQRGKKSLAERVVYYALENIKIKHSLDPLETFNLAIQNIKPMLELKSTRVGGAKYQVPCPVDDNRGYMLAMKWLIDSSRNRSEKGIHQKLELEILDASKGRGTSIKKRDDVHKMAEANKAFAHYNQRNKKQPSTAA